MDEAKNEFSVGSLSVESKQSHLPTKIILDGVELQISWKEPM